MERAAANCILCDSPERSLLFRQDDWSVYRCGVCGLGFLDPRPDANELGDLYRDGYFDDQYGHGLTFGSPEMKKRLSQESHRIRFFRRVKQSGKVLDIGCGMGYFLLASRDAGYEVEGMDISQESAAYVRREMEIPVVVGTIRGIDYPPESFDVITMWHFLEHTPDPRLYLKKAQQWLKRDGVLVVDVPNYRGTDARKSWARWKGWQLPYHLYHYTPETLRRLLANHGLGVVRSKSYLSEHVKENLERTLVLKPFARLIARCYSGHSFAVVAKKMENCGQASP